MHFKKGNPLWTGVKPNNYPIRNIPREEGKYSTSSLYLEQLISLIKQIYGHQSNGFVGKESECWFVWLTPIVFHRRRYLSMAQNNIPVWRLNKTLTIEYVYPQGIWSISMGDSHPFLSAGNLPKPSKEVWWGH